MTELIKSIFEVDQPFGRIVVTIMVGLLTISICAMVSIIAVAVYRGQSVEVFSLVKIGEVPQNQPVVVANPTNQPQVEPAATTAPQSVATNTSVAAVVDTPAPLPTYTPLPTFTPVPPEPAAPVESQNQSATNLVRNGGFDEQLQGSGWESGGQISIENGYNNTNAICSIQNDANDGFLWIGIAQELSVISGQGYNYSAWLKWENAAQVHLQIWWFDASGQKLSESFPAGPYDGNSNGWVQKGGNIVAPTNSVRARIMVWHGVLNNSNKVPGSKMCVDDVVFSPL